MAKLLSKTLCIIGAFSVASYIYKMGYAAAKYETEGE